jgi:hypothetical protein
MHELQKLMENHGTMQWRVIWPEALRACVKRKHAVVEQFECYTVEHYTVQIIQ